jgi:hypothetical protein
MEPNLVLCKQGVAGSIPVTSTNFFLIANTRRILSLPNLSVRFQLCLRGPADTCPSKVVVMCKFLLR